MSTPNITLYYNPHSRAAGVRVLLEELGAPYTLKAVDFQKGEQLAPAFTALNPMGKLPTITDGDTVVTEQVAIYIHLADRFPKAGLAPAIDAPLRGSYLRWIAFYGSCFEPAIIDKHQKREPAPRAMNPYGDFDTMYSTLLGQLEKGPWILGETFSAADVLWGAALTWMTGFKLVPENPTVAAYVERFNARPAVKRTQEKDAAPA